MYRYVILCLTLIFTSTTLADTKKYGPFYAELDAMYFLSPSDFDTEQTMGFTLGYSPDDKQSWEFEFQVNGLDSGLLGYEVDADLFTYLLGYRYNLSQTGAVTYFAGAGIGYSNAEYYTDPNAKSDQDLTIGFVRVGLDYNVTDNWYVSGEVRYQYIPDLDKNSVNYDIGGVPVLGLSVGYRF